MEHRILGRTGLKVSAIGVGGWQLAGPMTLDGKPDGFTDVGREQAVRTIQACAELGINYIDTAEVYGDGEGERRVGEAINGHRDKWIVATKFGLRRGSNGERVCDVRPDAIRGSLEQSLRRLRTEYVDVYMFHSPPRQDHLDDSVAVLLKLRADGLIRHFGISTADARLTESLARNGLNVVLFPHSLVTSLPVVRTVIRQYQLGGVVRGVFEGGRLTGRYFRSLPAFAADDIRSRGAKSDWSRYAAFEALLPSGWTMRALALRHVLDSDTTHVALVGGSTPEHFAEAAAAARLPALDRAVQHDIARCARRISGVSLPRAAVRWLRSKVRHLVNGR